MAKDYGYVERFGKMGFGMFVHYGLYSVCGRGEWAYYFNKMWKGNIISPDIRVEESLVGFRKLQELPESRNTIAMRDLSSCRGWRL